MSVDNGNIYLEQYLIPEDLKRFFSCVCVCVYVLKCASHMSHAYKRV